jgi:hypothetical protein
MSLTGINTHAWVDGLPSGPTHRYPGEREMALISGGHRPETARGGRGAAARAGWAAWSSLVGQNAGLGPGANFSSSPFFFFDFLLFLFWNPKFESKFCCEFCT